MFLLEVSTTLPEGHSNSCFLSKLVPSFKRTLFSNTAQNIGNSNFLKNERQTSTKNKISIPNHSREPTEKPNPLINVQSGKLARTIADLIKKKLSTHLISQRLFSTVVWTALLIKERSIISALKLSIEQNRIEIYQSFFK